MRNGRFLITAIFCLAFLANAVEGMSTTASAAEPARTAQNVAIEAAPKAETPAETSDEEGWGNGWNDDSWLEEDVEDPSVPDSEKYTLERCISLALANNLELKAADWEIEYSEARANEAWWAWFPRITIRSILAPAPDYNPPPFSDPAGFLGYDAADWAFEGIVWGNEISLLAPIFTFGKISSVREMGALGRKAGLEKRRVTRSKIVYDIKRTYYTLQLVERMIAAFDEGMEYLNGAEKKLEELLASGSESVTEFDRYKFEVVRAEMLARIEEAYKNRKVLTRALLTMMNLPLDTSFHLKRRFLPRPTEVAELLDLAARSAEMEGKRPEYELLDLGLALKETEAKRQWAYYFPDFFLALKYEYIASPELEEIENPYLNDPFHANSLTGYVGLSYTFDLPLQIARARQADAQRSQFEKTRENLRNQMGLQLENAVRHYEQKLKQMKISHEGEKYGRKWMVSAYVSYNVGTIESSDMVEAIAAYFKTQFSYHVAVSEVLLAEAELASLLGRDAGLSSAGPSPTSGVDARPAAPATAP
ncbi:MAG: TolC family protein [Myxococcales bacterium]|nr:MAG: TolC family protein [Myxococcales bacterium]